MMYPFHNGFGGLGLSGLNKVVTMVSKVATIVKRVVTRLVTAANPPTKANSLLGGLGGFLPQEN